MRNPSAVQLQVPDSDATPAPPARALAIARTLAPACGSAKTPAAPAARWDIPDPHSRQKAAAVPIRASCAMPRPAPAFANGFPAVPGARGPELREEPPAPAVCECPSDQTFQPNVRPALHRKKNFPATHPPADLPAALLRALRESGSRRENRGLRAKQHPDSRPRQCSLPVPSARHAAPNHGQSSGAGRATARARQGSEARRRTWRLPLPEKTIARNRAARRARTFPAIPSARAAPDFPTLPVATWPRLARRLFAVLFR